MGAYNVCILALNIKIPQKIVTTAVTNSVFAAIRESN